MSSDDLTRKLPDDDGKTTQPMIADVFRLVEEVKQSMESRFDATDARLDQTNARLDQTNARLDQTNARLDQTNARLDQTNPRLDQTNARLDEVESRLARDIAGVNTRIAELSDEMKNGFIQLSDKIVRSRLHAEADYQDILRRMRELESKAS
jgi:methyl-accepting chemotaxis protein